MIVAARRGWSRCSATRSPARSRLGCRTPLRGARASTGPTSRVTSAPEGFETAVRGLAAAGFVGANVTTPHKRPRRRLRRRISQSVNTLVFEDGRSAATRRMRRSSTASVGAPGVVGDGGAAGPFARRCRGAGFSRRGEWPPDVGDADLVVNATSERDEVLVELGRARRSSTCRIRRRPRRGRRARRAVVSGLEVLVAQGAASFELWTGVPAPVEVMRRAVGLAP